jgi:hypothetical protein
VIPSLFFSEDGSLSASSGGEEKNVTAEHAETAEKKKDSGFRIQDTGFRFLVPRSLYLEPCS